MFNTYLENMNEYRIIFKKIPTEGNAFTYEPCSWKNLKKGNIFIAHTDDGPVKNKNNGVEFYAESDVYLDQLSIPCINVRPANEYEKGKAS